MDTNIVDAILIVIPLENDRAFHFRLQADSPLPSRIREFSIILQASTRRIFNSGKESIQQEVERLCDYIEIMKAELGSQADALNENLLAFLIDRYKKIQLVFISRQPAEIEVGGENLKISSVELQAKLSLSPELKFALTEFLSLACGGEISVSVVYSTQNKRSKENFSE